MKILNKIKKKIHHANGYTLIEMAITIAAIGIIITVLVPFFKVNLQSYIQVQHGKILVQSARIGLHRMMSEMNEVVNPWSFDYTTSSGVQFTNQDGNYISYRFQDEVLQRRESLFAGSWVSLIEGVQSFAISYYRNDGTSFSPNFFTQDEIWRIEVEMAVGDGTSNFQLKDQISPRMFHVR